MRAADRTTHTHWVRIKEQKEVEVWWRWIRVLMWWKCWGAGASSGSSMFF